MICTKVVNKTDNTNIDGGMLVVSRTTGNIYLTLNDVEINVDGEPELINTVLLSSDKYPERCGIHVSMVRLDNLRPFKGEITLIQE